MASGELSEVIPFVKVAFDRDPGTLILIFEDQTGKNVDFELSGPLADVLDRYRPPHTRSGPGRPKLGVVAREVSLLPRHWEWLERQSGGASAAIRRLVEQARRDDSGDERRRATDAAYRFLTVMGGNRPNYEEAIRALYAHDRDRFNDLIRDWPADIRTHAERMTAHAF